MHILPISLGIFLSLLRLGPDTIGHWTAAPYAGLGNYRSGLDTHGATGAELLHTVLRTVAFTGLVVTVSWGIGIFAAVLLTTRFRGRTLLQAYFLIPFALPAYVTGLGWRFMLDRDNGAVNRLLVDDLHLFSNRPFWLIGGNAFWATVLVAVWRLWPFAYLMLHASMQALPAAAHEAAAMDGATAWQRFRFVTLPSIRRTNAIVVLIMAMWSFNEFAVPYVVFGGDPPPSATMIANLIYRNAFATFDVGVASAMNVMLVGLLLIVLLPWARRILRREPANA